MRFYSQITSINNLVIGKIHTDPACGGPIGKVGTSRRPRRLRPQYAALRTELTPTQVLFLLDVGAQMCSCCVRPQSGFHEWLKASLQNEQSILQLTNTPTNPQGESKDGKTDKPGDAQRRLGGRTTHDH